MEALRLAGSGTTTATPSEPHPPFVSGEVRASRALLLAAAVIAAVLPLMLLAPWYAADLGPEFTSEGVAGWDVGSSARALLALTLAALVGLALSAGATPASDGERITAVLAASALTAAAAIVWYRVAVVPEPAGLFVRRPGLWVSALLASGGAAAAICYAALARLSEIERLEAARGSG